MYILGLGTFTALAKINVSAIQSSVYFRISLRGSKCLVSEFKRGEGKYKSKGGATIWKVKC